MVAPDDVRADPDTAKKPPEPDGRESLDLIALQLLRGAAARQPLRPIVSSTRPPRPEPVSAPAPLAAPSVPAVASTPGVVARLRKSLFNPLGGGSRGAAVPGPVNKQKQIGFRASLAEFLLINRLRARIRPVEPAQAADVLQRGAQIIFVTCKAWFGDAEVRERDQGSRL